MPILAKQLQQYSGDYVRGGGKGHRRKQVKRIMAFLDWVESTGKVMSLHGVGKNHVIGFWKAHRHLSDKTLHEYWLGIVKLWGWLNKSGEPPEPRKATDIAKPELTDTQQLTGTRVTELSAAVKYAREAMKLTVRQLANLSGMEVTLIEGIENGGVDASLLDALNLLRILKITLLVSA
jgi:DNA-binding transcriptional regulator YiaG